MTKGPGFHRPRGTYGAGSVRELEPGKFEARVHIARGRYVSRTGKSRAEALRRAREAADARTGRTEPNHTRPKNPTVRDALRAYARHLDARVANGDLLPRSRRPIDDAVQRVEDQIGDTLLDNLTPAWLEAWASRLTLAPSTNRKTWDALRNSIRYARRDGLLDGPDPFDDVTTRPKTTRREDPAHATAQDVSDVLDAFADEPQWLAFFTVLGFTGMRTIEVRHLTWGDVDLDAETITVRRTSTKTDAGVRVVPMLPPVKSALEAHRARRGRKPRPGDYVFVGEVSGRPLAYALPGKALERVLPGRGLTPKAFRHGAVTRMLEAGVSPHLVAATVGHTDPGFTMRTYAHAVLRAQREGLSALEG